jgi:hypothetical protein
MPVNFPNSPSVNDLYNYNDKTWQWNGIYWDVYSGLTSYITSAYTVGDGYSDISGVTNGNLALKSFSGTNITIIDSGSKLTFSGISVNDVPQFSGGTVSGATIFTNGLTANTISATTYQNLPTDVFVTGGTYSNGTATFTNNTGGTFSIIGFTTPFTGGTVTGATNFTNGLSANTISATTYQNLPTDVFVTGGTYSNGSATFTNNTGGTFTVTGFYTGATDVFVTGGTYSNGTATFTNNTGGTFTVSGFTTPFTGGTVTGATSFTNGLTANTISATTYQNLPTDVFVTGGTYSNSTITFTNNTGGTFTVTGINTPFTGGTVTGATNFTGGLTANTLTVNGNATITGNTTVTGTISGNTLISTQSSGDEGGQIDLYIPQTNNTLSGTSITIDSYQNKLRIFESGGSNRGGYIDLTSTDAGVATNLASITAYKNVTPASVTGSTTTTALQSIFIPANTFKAGDILEITTRGKKVGTAGTLNFRLHQNTSISFTGDLVVGSFGALAANILYAQGIRTLNIVNATGSTEVFPTGVVSLTDIAINANAISSLAINWTVDQYLFTSALPANSADTFTSTFLLIKRIR